LFEACWDESLHARLGARTTERLVQFVTQISKWAERAGHEAAVPLVKEMLEEVGYRRWIEAQADNPVEAERRNGNIDDLLAWMSRLAGTAAEPRPLAEILSQLSLLEAMTERDGDEAADCVRLMTLHAAKGLEFPHVFLVGMEEEVLPHRSSLEADDVTEERRLAYVGITRARQTLTLTWAASRRRYGETRDTQISRFINELPADDLEWVGQASEPRVSTDEGRQVLASLRNLLR
jgi:ATP-dependent DNA helicase Rep